MHIRYAPASDKKVRTPINKCSNEIHSGKSPSFAERMYTPPRATLNPKNRSAKLKALTIISSSIFVLAQISNQPTSKAEIL